MKFFSLIKIIAIFFLNADYEYTGRDWLTMGKWSVPLRGQIKYCDYLKKVNGQKYFDFFYYAYIYSVNKIYIIDYCLISVDITYLNIKYLT